MSSDDILQPLPLEKWPLLAETLKKDWPNYAQYYYFVQTAIKWRSKEPNLPHTIYCPEANHNSGIFVGISSYALYYVVLFAHEGFEEILQKAVTETKIIKWSEGVYFPAIQFRLIPTVYSIIETLKQKKKMEMNWSLPGHCFFKSKEECSAVEVQVPDGCYLKKIEESDAPFINSMWPHRFEENPDLSTKYVLAMVRFNGGIGLFSKDNDELLSWILQSDLGALSLVQTIERCKRRGYAKVVINAFAKELADKGVDSFLFVIKGNLASEMMFKSLKWKLIYPHDWIQMKELKD